MSARCPQSGVLLSDGSWADSGARILDSLTRSGELAKALERAEQALPPGYTPLLWPAVPVQYAEPLGGAR